MCLIVHFIPGAVRYREGGGVMTEQTIHGDRSLSDMNGEVEYRNVLDWMDSILMRHSHHATLEFLFLNLSRRWHDIDIHCKQEKKN